MSAMMMFAMRLGALRVGTSAAQAALVFLQRLTPEVLVLLAMMADAGSLVITLIRVLDAEDM